MSVSTTRLYAESVPSWQRFQAKLLKGEETSVYQKQYSHVYHQRLAALKPYLTVPSIRILELAEDVKSTVIGTVVKSDEGTFLEDESGRVSIETSDPVCTGCVLGLTGTVGLDGVLKVETIHTPATVQISDALNPPPNKDDPHVLLISGLECGSAEHSSVPRDLLVSYLQGLFGDSAAKVAHVIVAGGLVDPQNDQGVRELDLFLYQLTQHVPVSILPGEHDPTTANWPQRPLHRALLSKSSQSMLLNRAPNPMSSTFDDKIFLGTDGKNVSVMEGSMMDNLLQTLSCRHVCPMGPDTVPTVPHADRDPMVMEKLPDVYFCGNTEAFATQSVLVNNDHPVRVMCLPKFSTTSTAALVNLKTLGVELVKFEV